MTKLVARIRNFANVPKTTLHKHTVGLFVTSETSLALLHVAGPAMHVSRFICWSQLTKLILKAICKNEDLLCSVTLGDTQQCVDCT